MTDIWWPNYILRWDGSWWFSVDTTSIVNWNSTSFGSTIIDFNNDGNNDILIANAGGTTPDNEIWFGDWTGNFYGDASLTVAWPSYAVWQDWFRSHTHVADLNNDGQWDVIVGNDRQPNHIYYGDGSGNFYWNVWFNSTSPYVFGSGWTRGIDSFDVDADGFEDIILWQYDLGIEIWINDTLWWFSLSQTLMWWVQQLGYEGEHEVEHADLNWDGFVDIVSAGRDNANEIRRWDWTWWFTLDNQFIWEATNDLDLIDIDNDGDIDILNGSWPNRWVDSWINELFLNDGSWNFTLDQNVRMSLFDWNTSYWVEWADFNNDGYMDFIFPGWNDWSKHMIWLSDGDNCWYEEAMCEACHDADSDGVCDTLDNCPWIANSDQNDTDGDGIWDICDSPLCGNWFVEWAEECDDGNTIAWDYCSSSCEIEYCRDDAPITDTSKNLAITSLSPSAISWTSSQPNSKLAICFEDTTGSRDIVYISTDVNGDFIFTPDLSIYIWDQVNVWIMLHDENGIDLDHHALILSQ